eukprot:UN05603
MYRCKPKGIRLSLCHVYFSRFKIQIDINKINKISIPIKNHNIPTIEIP